MKGLLLKDFYTLIKQMGIFLVMIAMFACMPGYNMFYFSITYCAMIPLTALAYDERSKWDQLAVMMPYSAKMIVFSKYVLGYICVIVAGGISIVAQAVMGFINGSLVKIDDLLSVTFVICFGIIMVAVIMPMMFKFGVEKGRIILFVIIAAVIGGGMFVAPVILEKLSSVEGSMLTSALLMIVATVVLNIISVYLSVVFYVNREGKN